MAAEVAASAGLRVDVFDSQGSVGRKFLLAGKGGLNLTHSEPFVRFVGRYGPQADWVRPWLQAFDAEAIRGWARALGVDTIVGTSRRVFPADLKAAPLLRGWVRQLRATGVRLHAHHRWEGFANDGAVLLATPQGLRAVTARATVLALGGASWPQLGSDGAWWPRLAALGVPLAPLCSANCGFDVPWTQHFAQRHAGAPVKTVRLSSTHPHGAADTGEPARGLQGECVITATGIEGSGVYALSRTLREALERDGAATLWLDLLPQQSVAETRAALAAPRNGRSLSEQLRRRLGLQGVKTALLYECTSPDARQDPARLADSIHGLPVPLAAPRPMAEAISTAGGVRAEALNGALMLRALRGVFCAGEMLDWEAPTGGYLLSACFASGRVAGAGAVDWIKAQAR
jgi:hypothetical protein